MSSEIRSSDRFPLDSANKSFQDIYLKTLKPIFITAVKLVILISELQLV
jgi:hypothetical protein